MEAYFQFNYLADKAPSVALYLQSMLPELILMVFAAVCLAVCLIGRSLPIRRVSLEPCNEDSSGFHAILIALVVISAILWAQHMDPSFLAVSLLIYIGYVSLRPAGY